MKSCRWFFAVLNKSKSKIVMLSFLSALSASFLLLTTYFANIFIKEIENNGLHSITLPLVLLIFSITFGVILNIIYSKYLVKNTIDYRNISLKFCYNKLLLSKLSYINSIHSGELVNTLSSDIDLAISNYFALLPTLVSVIIKLLVGIIILFVISYKITLICLGLGLVIAIFMMLYRTKFKKYHKNVQKSNGKYKAFLQESLQNFEVLKIYNVNENMLFQLDKKLEKNKQDLLKKNNLSILASNFAYLLLSVTLYVAIIVGAIEIINKNLSFHEFVFMVMLLEIVKAPFNQITSIFSGVFAMQASIERVKNIISNTENFEENTSDFDRIIFENVSFCYDKNSIFDNINFEIKSGDKLLLTGVSGAGKSTFIRLLLGLLNQSSGEIYAELNDKKFSHFSDIFAFVPQNNLIFSGTILDNLKIVNENASMSDVKNACKIACIDSEIENMQNGYDTILEECGKGLSQGQMQRLSIARAILSDRKFLVFDEATSGLNDELEKLVLDNIFSEVNKTILFISHNKNIKAYANKHINISNKKVEIINE